MIFLIIIGCVFTTSSGITFLNPFFDLFSLETDIPSLNRLNSTLNDNITFKLKEIGHDSNTTNVTINNQEKYNKSIKYNKKPYPSIILDGTPNFNSITNKTNTTTDEYNDIYYHALYSILIIFISMMLVILLFSLSLSCCILYNQHKNITLEKDKVVAY